MELCEYEAKEQEYIISPDMAADNNSEATKYALDVQLISAVREFPLLYDPKARNYRDLEIVSGTWKEIAKAMGADEWTECKERWRKLRDAYVKLKKNATCQPGGKKKPTWVHFDGMSFLAEHITHRHDKRGTKRSIDVHDEMQDVTVSVKEELEEAKVGSSKRRDGKKGKKIDPMQVTIVEALAQGTNSSKMAPDVILDDEEGLFGRMVAATLRRFPPRAKARCKFRIQEIIFQQENENLGGGSM